MYVCGCGVCGLDVCGGVWVWVGGCGCVGVSVGCAGVRVCVYS